MTQTNHSTSQPIEISLRTRMLIGAGIGLLVISFLILPVDPDPTWGNLWMIRPLIIVPFAGAMGGLCNYLLLHYRRLVGLNKTIAIILSVIVAFVGLWMGVVLGLVGTMWH